MPYYIRLKRNRRGRLHKPSYQYKDTSSREETQANIDIAHQALQVSDSVSEAQKIVNSTVSTPVSGGGALHLNLQAGINKAEELFGAGAKGRSALAHRPKGAHSASKPIPLSQLLRGVPKHR